MERGEAAHSPLVRLYKTRLTPQCFQNIMVKDLDQVEREFYELVNMTSTELRSWIETDESKGAGWTHDGGETVGHQSATKIIDILEKEEDVAHMRRVVAYCKRHLAQEQNLTAEKSEDEIRQSKSYKSLKNWGHDMLKEQGKRRAEDDLGDQGKKVKRGDDRDDGEKEDQRNEENDQRNEEDDQSDEEDDQSHEGDVESDKEDDQNGKQDDNDEQEDTHDKNQDGSSEANNHK